ncbi:MAG: NAD+ synthase, partial [Aeromonadaceae bacterium]|nr:NAD+ synthase [Aeromonadaceae bacterium]
MAKALSLMLAQLNLTVGAIEDNCDKVLAAAAQAEQQGADLLVCSELALTGYPPEDLLLRSDLMIRVDAALARIATWQGSCAILVGHPWREGAALYNAASLYEQGKLVAR